MKTQIDLYSDTSKASPWSYLSLTLIILDSKEQIENILDRKIQNHIPILSRS